jgi:2-polyprenyl-3-methyl-5-hydroxy-6-metoxy-1,4-benzoquinol methylase
MHRVPVRRSVHDIAASIRGVCASPEQLQHDDAIPADTFDAICELGVLHHVADPNEVVSEMTLVCALPDEPT